MNHKQSMLKLFLSVAGTGLLVSNCTIKASTDAASAGSANNTSAGAGNAAGSANNTSAGAGNAAGSANNTSAGAGGSNTGGASSYAGASEAGASPAEAGAAGEGPLVYANCEDCLASRCQAKYEACDANPNCISTNVDGSGQFERIEKCINEQRIHGLVKRDVVRGCGVTIGASADPDVISAWAPEDMDPVTTDLLNCMADAPGAAAASWANDDANYPVSGNDMINPTPWPDGTCAKLACTSAL
jgi:hypothetical protein